MGPAMSASVTDLQVERAEALIALARVRLRPPEREQAVGQLQAAIQAVRQPHPAGQEVDASQAARAEEKAAQAEGDREEKRRPYEADPIFMYLWRRRYGTRDYHASNLVRFFDRKVAQLIDFESARLNYTMLMELPDRLREHAERLKASGAALPGRDPARRLAEAQSSPALLALTREAGGTTTAEEAEILRRIGEIDATLASLHQPVVTNE
jgi:hypothetical protein